MFIQCNSNYKKETSCNWLLFTSNLPEFDRTTLCLMVPALSFANGIESDSVLELLDYKNIQD